MAPAHPHATGVAVYLALLFFSLSLSKALDDISVFEGGCPTDHGCEFDVKDDLCHFDIHPDKNQFHTQFDWEQRSLLIT